MSQNSITALKKVFHATACLHREAWEQQWAAVGIVFREHHGQLELLFIERAEHPDDAWSGHMAFPGGRRDNQETVAETAIRECHEEVGLDLAGGAELLGYLPPLRAYKQGLPQNFSLVPVGFYLTKEQTLKLDAAEVASAHWLGLNWLFDQANHSRFEYCHAGENIFLPCIPLSKNKIWGLTYRVIDLLQSRIP